MEGKENVTVIVNDAVAGSTTEISFGTTTPSKDFKRLAIVIVIAITTASYIIMYV